MSNDATRPYTNNTTREERAEYLLNEKELRKRAERLGPASTFSQFGAADANQERQGRHTQAERRPIFNNEMPHLPSDHWSDQAGAVGLEPPYDGDMSTPIVGESFEVAASIESLERAAQDASASLDAEPARGAAGSAEHHGIEPAANPIPTNNRKRPPR